MNRSARGANPDGRVLVMPSGGLRPFPRWPCYGYTDAARAAAAASQACREALLERRERERSCVREEVGVARAPVCSLDDCGGWMVW